MNLRTFSSVQDRRKAVEQEKNVSLAHIGYFNVDESVASQRNCENMIGVVQVPLGVAGPLLLSETHNKDNKYEYYIPLATTEGALVASVNRGCKAIAESGGATVSSYMVGTTRGPVFHTQSALQNQHLFEFINNNNTTFQDIIAQTSRHLHLLSVSSRSIGRYQYARFAFDTGDAMGMNMVTIATKRLVSYIEEKTGARCLSLSGNYCVDKKPAWLNFVEARGTEVWAETTISSKTLENSLKTTAQAVYDVWLTKCMIGSAISGSMGFNAQYANIIAALFLATGQDIAHVTEGSLGITTTEIVRSPEGDALYISIYIPDLMIGTVGGGTGLATQREALSLLGVFGGMDGKNKEHLAQIIGASVLAGEISLLSSLAQGSLAEAHETLARGVTKKDK